MNANNFESTNCLNEENHMGLIHVLFGGGVGKTSTAVGMAFRAAASGLQVYFIQFMKSDISGELNILKQISNIHYYSPGSHPFIKNNNPQKIHFDHANKALEYAWEAVGGDAQVLVCDELLNTILFGILTKEKILDLIDSCKNRVELILTGKVVPQEIVEVSDYVNEFINIKHPYDTGIGAREGIEY